MHAMQRCPQPAQHTTAAQQQQANTATATAASSAAHLADALVGGVHQDDLEVLVHSVLHAVQAGSTGRQSKVVSDRTRGWTGRRWCGLGGGEEWAAQSLLLRVLVLLQAC